ncbi:MAG: ROK family protein, partial [Candidatus Dormibacteraeota bacterium]|nr:ROK family protein [Candidatus Dormibacteraeota bacterium]
ARDTAYVVAISITHHHVRAALADLNAEPRCVIEDDVGTDDRQAVLEHVRRLIEEVLVRSEVPRDRVQGIGVGVEGPVEAQSGSLRTVSPLVGPLAIHDDLEREYPWPVVVDNDANLLALAEAWAAGARDSRDFFFVKIGSGVGCGIFFDGQLYRGADGWAGELGHVPVPGHDGPCTCGNAGCLNTVAAGPALAAAAEELARSGASAYLRGVWKERERLSAEDLGAALRHGDQAAAGVIKRAGNSVGQVLGGIVSFCNPSLIVIGGRATRLGDLLLSAIREGVYRWSLPLSARHLAITASQLGDDGPLIGAAAMALGAVYGIVPFPGATGAAAEAIDQPAAPAARAGARAGGAEGQTV